MELTKRNNNEIILEVVPFNAHQTAQQENKRNSKIARNMGIVKNSIENHIKSEGKKMDRDLMTMNEKKAVISFFKSVFGVDREYSRVSTLLNTYYSETMIMKDRISVLEEQVSILKPVFDRANDIEDHSGRLAGEFHTPLNNDIDIVNKTAHEILRGSHESTEIIDHFEAMKEDKEDKECFLESAFIDAHKDMHPDILGDV